MADKSTKTTKAKPKATRGKGVEPSVLASLPSTRAARIGGRRGSPAAQTPAPEARPKPATKAKAKASAGPKKAKAPVRAKTKAGAAAPPKAAPTRRPKPVTPPEPVLTSVGADTMPEPGPRPVRPAAPSLGTGGERPGPDTRTGPPSGTELVTTAIQAAGELATIGVKVSGHILKRAVDRLPKP